MVKPSAIAVDTRIALMDALKYRRRIVAGFDWGGRTGPTSWRRLWPERLQRNRLGERYLLGSQAAGKDALDPKLSSIVGSRFIRHEIAGGRLRPITRRRFPRTDDLAVPRRSGKLR